MANREEAVRSEGEQNIGGVTMWRCMYCSFVTDLMSPSTLAGCGSSPTGDHELYACAGTIKTGNLGRAGLSGTNRPWLEETKSLDESHAYANPVYLCIRCRTAYHDVSDFTKFICHARHFDGLALSPRNKAVTAPHEIYRLVPVSLGSDSVV